MKRDLKRLPKFTLVCLAVKDEASRKLRQNGVIDILAGYGSKEIKKLGFRQGWAFIGMKGSSFFVEARAKNAKKPT